MHARTHQFIPSQKRRPRRLLKSTTSSRPASLRHVSSPLDLPPPVSPLVRPSLPFSTLSYHPARLTRLPATCVAQVKTRASPLPCYTQQHQRGGCLPATSYGPPSPRTLQKQKFHTPVGPRRELSREGLHPGVGTSERRRYFSSASAVARLVRAPPPRPAPKNKRRDEGGVVETVSPLRSEPSRCWCCFLVRRASLSRVV